MIKILKENNELENMTDEQIQQLYDAQKIRITELVQTKIDLIMEKLPKYVDSISMEIIKDVIPSYYFNRDNLIITDMDDLEERVEEIKDILRLKDSSDEIINVDIDEIIQKIVAD